MKALPVKNHDPLCALLNYAKVYGTQDEQTKHSERFLGHLPKKAAYDVRTMLKKQMGIKIQLWPRRPITKVPKQNPHTYRRSQSMRHHGDCALYTVGCNAEKVYALVSVLG